MIIPFPISILFLSLLHHPPFHYDTSLPISVTFFIVLYRISDLYFNLSILVVFISQTLFHAFYSFYFSRFSSTLFFSLLSINQWFVWSFLCLIWSIWLFDTSVHARLLPLVRSLLSYSVTLFPPNPFSPTLNEVSLLIILTWEFAPRQKHWEGQRKEGKLEIRKFKEWRWKREAGIIWSMEIKVVEKVVITSRKNKKWYYNV